MSTVRTSAPRCNPAAPRPAPPRVRVLMRSDANRRGRAIRDAARHLLDLIDGYESSNAEGQLYHDFEAAGLRAPGRGWSADLGTLDHLGADLAGFRWLLDLFIDLVDGAVIDKVEADPEPAAANLIGVEPARTSSARGARRPR